MDNHLSITPAKRMPLFVDVEYKKNYARKQNVGTMKNISITGAFVSHGIEKLHLNEKIMIHFRVGGRMRKIQASVVWTDAKGGGIKFHPFNKRDIQIIDDLMYFVRSKKETKVSLLDNIFKQVS